MTFSRLAPNELRITVDVKSLGFSDTSELIHLSLPWIGQERAEEAANFGLNMEQSNYHLFVLGEIGSGRSSLLGKLLQKVAINRATPPDLCYLHNFDSPDKPKSLQILAGQGRLLRDSLAKMIKTIQKEIPERNIGNEFKVEKERIEKVFKVEETLAYDELVSYADTRGFAIYRENEQLVFSLLGDKGVALTEAEVRSLSKERRVQIEQLEQELRDEITRFLIKIRPLERKKNEDISALRRRIVKPLLELQTDKIRNSFITHVNNPPIFNSYLECVSIDLLENLELFKTDEDNDEEEITADTLETVLSRYKINLLVDNFELVGAPVIIDNNPSFRSLFGSIEYKPENESLLTNFFRIRAGNLHRANGGFLMLHLRDLLTDDLVWDKLRRFLRSGQIQIEEPVPQANSIGAVSLEPEAVEAKVKIVLIGSNEQYYQLYGADPEFARRFRVKVDFAESFRANPETYRGYAIFVSHTCHRLNLPHFSASAIARLIEVSHREVDDKSRQSAIFAKTEALVIESSIVCRNRLATLVDSKDIEVVIRSSNQRHNYPDQRLQESVTDGDRLISLFGEKIGQLNGLTQIDLGDYCFGFPVRITARTFAGNEGLLNIEREVEMSGPIHDKGVLILHSYLSALFAHLAPLALNASIVFEQEYQGVEGDSASCAELYVLLSSLSNLPLKQGIAVTGAVNLHGEVLPVGGINEKIEGYFRICETAGLDGKQGVLIPSRNKRHLMLDHKVIEAVNKGLFHVYTVDHVSEGIELLTGHPFGIGLDGSDNNSVINRAEESLRAYRRACQLADDPNSKIT